MTDDDAPDKADDLHERGKKLFARAGEAEADNRRDFLEDVRFSRLEEQWPDEVKKKRLREGRPCLTINKLPSFIRQVVNDARQNKPGISTHPADDHADPETAEIYNGLIRNIEYASDADVAYDTGLENAVQGGFGYLLVDTEYACDDTFEQDIRIKPVADPLTVYGDPHSTGHDSADWNDGFVVERITKAEFKKRFPKAKRTNWETDFRDGGWIDGDDVTVARWYHREEIARQIVAVVMPLDAPPVPGVEVKPGEVQVMDLSVYKANQAHFDAMGAELQGEPREVKSHKVTCHLMSGAEVLESTPWPGKYIPIVPIYGEMVVVEGKRHLISMIRAAKDAQRMFNYWRTCATENVALAPKAPFIGPKGAFDTDADKWSTANSEAHPFIEYDGAQAPQRQGFTGPDPGSLQEAMNASDDMKAIMGMFDASLGAQSNETSGRAIIARQREGDVSTFAYIDNLSRSIRHCGRILIDLIPKIYSTPRILRVLGPDKKPALVAVNGAPPPQPQQQAGMAPQPGQQPPQPQQDPSAVNTARVYDLTVGKYDITVEAGPGYTTKREEAAEQMMEFIRVFPQAAPLIGDLLAKNLDWPGAKEVSQRLAAMLPPQAQGQNPQVMQMQQQMQQMGQQGQMLQTELAALKADHSVKQAEVQLKAKEIEIKGFEAQTDRMKVMAEIARPDPITGPDEFGQAA